jgi:hypothetical protein
MPRNPDYFSPSQVRHRLRQVLQPYSQRGGGISMRVLLPWQGNGFNPILARDSDFADILTWQNAYMASTEKKISGLGKISEALEHAEYQRVNRVWHIGIFRGVSVIPKAYTIHIGSHTHSPMLWNDVPSGCNWLFRGDNYDLLFDCLLPSAVQQMSPLQQFASNGSNEVSTSNPQMDVEVEI